MLPHAWFTNLQWFAICLSPPQTDWPGRGRSRAVDAVVAGPQRAEVFLLLPGVPSASSPGQSCNADRVRGPIHRLSAVRSQPGRPERSVSNVEYRDLRGVHRWGRAQFWCPGQHHREPVRNEPGQSGTPVHLELASDQPAGLFRNGVGEPARRGQLAHDQLPLVHPGGRHGPDEFQWVRTAVHRVGFWRGQHVPRPRRISRARTHPRRSFLAGRMRPVLRVSTSG